jgi:hypothetical protein
VPYYTAWLNQACWSRASVAVVHGCLQQYQPLHLTHNIKHKQTTSSMHQPCCMLPPTADLRSQLLESQNKARLEVTAARCEAQDLSAQLQESQRQLGALQQQLSDSAGQQAALRGSVQQLAADAEPELAAKVQKEAR